MSLLQNCSTETFKNNNFYIKNRNESINQSAKVMIEDVAIDSLKQVKNALDKYNVEFWLDIGTLLGAARDGKIITWDHDIDLGVWSEEVAKIIYACRKLRNQGFTIQLGRGFISIEKEGCPINILLYNLYNNKAIRRWGSYNVSNIFVKKLLNLFFWGLLSPHYARVDIMASFNIKSLSKIIISKINCFIPFLFRRWASKIESKWGSKYIWVIPSKYFMNLSTIKFYGMEFKVPAEIEEYLIYHYSKNWRIPKQDWDTIKNDGAIVLSRDYKGDF